MASNASKITMFATVSAVAFLLWKPFIDPLPMLIWNASASVRVGLYHIDKRRPVRGEIAVLKPPKWAALIADERHYLPRSAWLLKPVTAVNGDIVCKFGVYVFINGRTVARALRHDKLSRPMPKWKGCLKLKSGQLFLLSKHWDSFDSRYFGPVESSLVIGTAHPVILVGK